MQFEGLSAGERVELMRFLCSFAWADDEVQDEERVILIKVLDNIGLEPGDRATVLTWLERRPDMTGFDFAAIPRDKRELFLDLAFSVASAHGGLAKEELSHLQMFMNFANA